MMANIQDNHDAPEPEVIGETFAKDTWSDTLASWVITLIKYRLVVKSGHTTIANLSILFLVAVLVFAPHITVFAALLALILRYSVAMTKDFPDDRAESIRRFFNNLNPNRTAESKAQTPGDILGEDKTENEDPKNDNEL